MAVKIKERKSCTKTLGTTTRYVVHVNGKGVGQKYLGSFSSLESAEAAKERFIKNNPFFDGPPDFQPETEITSSELLRKPWKQGVIYE